MPVFIHDIATSVPKASTSQIVMRDKLKTIHESDRKTCAIIHRIYSQSGIDKRHIVIMSSEQTEKADAYIIGTPPSTFARNEIYKKEASKLFIETGKKLLESNSHISASDITHVITVSCTGFYAPGPDYDLVRALGLSPQIERYHIGFMGCFAAFPALKMAHSFCKNDEEAVVLIVTTELCSLHLQQKITIDDLVAGSVFSDGSSGALVSQKKSPKKAFAINGFAASLTPTGENDMAWDIGDLGFRMTLSTYVPDIIESNLKEVIQPLFDNYGITYQDIDYWALHPGGRAIVDKIERSLQLAPYQVDASRKTLANYGNMSSSTILFVLKEILLKKPKTGAKVLPMGFGPGLTIESGLLTIQ